MATAIFNIGLRVEPHNNGGVEGTFISEADIRAIHLLLPNLVVYIDIVQSDSERTAVVTISDDGLVESNIVHHAFAKSLAEGFCKLYRQDAVAVFSCDEAGPKGVLVGPKASAWGPFNARYFFLRDGSRLSEKLGVV